MLSSVLSRSIYQALSSDSVVTYEQRKRMLSRHSVQLFNIRNPEEFQASRIPDSVNIPWRGTLKEVTVSGRPTRENEWG